MRTRPCATTLASEMTPQELAGLKQWIQCGRREGRHLEIGTAAGGTLCFMMKCFEEAERPSFSVVDTMSYFADQFSLVQKNLSQHDLKPDAVEFRVMTSDEAFSKAETAGDRFSFILVDASHKIRHVMNDLRWLRLLEPGGLACFHDYGPSFKGVTWPVDRFLRRNPHFSRVGLEGTLLCIRKDREGQFLEVTLSDRLWASFWSPVLQWDLSLKKRMKRNPGPTI